VGYRYHRAPHPRGQGVLLRRHRRLVPASRRLGHRVQPAGGPGDKRAGHGHRLPHPGQAGAACMATTAPNSPLDLHRTDAQRRAAAVPEKPSATPATTPSPSRFGAACRLSCSTGGGGTPGSSSRMRSLSTSRASRTAVAIPRSAGRHRSTARVVCSRCRRCPSGRRG
jgi:hypothetical protein